MTKIRLQVEEGLKRKYTHQVLERQSNCTMQINITISLHVKKIRKLIEQKKKIQ